MAGLLQDDDLLSGTRTAPRADVEALFSDEDVLNPQRMATRLQEMEAESARKQAAREAEARREAEAARAAEAERRANRPSLLRSFTGALMADEAARQGLREVDAPMATVGRQGRAADSAELVDLSTPAPAADNNPSWLELGGKLVERAPDLFKQAGAGLVQRVFEGAGDSLEAYAMERGGGGLGGISPEIRRAADTYRTARDHLAERGEIPGQATGKELTEKLAASAPEVDPWSIKGLAFSMSESLIQMAPMIATAIGTRSPNLALGEMMTQVYGNTYAESRASGMTPEQASERAAVYAVAESLPEKLPLGAMMKPGGSFGGRLAKTSGLEAGEEVFNQAIQTGYDVGILKEDMTWGEAMEQLAYAGVLGFGIGGAMGAVAHPFTRATEGRNEAADVERARLQALEQAMAVRQRDIEAGTPHLTQSDIDSPIDTETLAAGFGAVANAQANAGQGVAQTQTPTQAPAEPTEAEPTLSPDGVMRITVHPLGATEQQAPEAEGVATLQDAPAVQADQWQPFYDPDTDAQLGWFNPETGDVRRLDEGMPVGEPGTAPVPDIAPAALVEDTSAPPPSAVAAPVEDGAPTTAATGAADDVVVAQTGADIAQAGTRVVEPTEAQKEAGNYRKGHVDVQGLQITIENPKGSTRSGRDPDGNSWSVQMPADYGYFKRTNGADGDQVDVYVGPDPQASNAWIVDQVDADTKAFDEHKVMLGFASEADAMAAYDAGFSDGRGPARRGGVREMGVGELKQWLQHGDTESPVAGTPAAPVPAQPAAKPDASEGERSSAETREEGLTPEPAAAEPTAGIRIEETPSGKSFTIYGINRARADELAAATGTKVRPLPRKDGGFTFANRHREAIEAALAQTPQETTAERPSDTATVKESLTVEPVVSSAEDTSALTALGETPAATETVEAATVEEPAESQAEVPTEPSTPATERLEDAGEKIGGARKDLYAGGISLSDLEGMTDKDAFANATKAKVWSEPDWAQQIEAGLPREAAAALKVIYDDLGAAPRDSSPDGMRAYVDAMNRIRALAEAVDNASDAYSMMSALHAQMVGEEGGNHTLSKDGRAIYFAALKKNRRSWSHSSRVERGAKKLLEQGFPAKAEPWMRSYRVQPWGPDEWVVIHNARASKVARDLPSREAAVARAKELYEADLVERRGSRKEAPARPHLDSVQRRGRNVREGRDIDSDDFIAEFGFRGVEFGNWVASDERQTSVNMAFEALHDLADVLGVPPNTLSLGGQLGIAFGARGQGGAKAHYEPDRLVINMTKLSGAGSLAHEWGHALDHYFGQLDREAKGREAWMFVSGSQPGGQGDASGIQARTHALRPEVAHAWDGVMQTLFHRQVDAAEAIRDHELAVEKVQALIDRQKNAIETTRASYERAKERGPVHSVGERRFDQFMKKADAFIAYQEKRIKALNDKIALTREHGVGPYPATRESRYAREAAKLSGKSGSSGYWARPTEMFARAFESFVFDRVAETEGHVSQYLVQGVEESRFASDRFAGNPYPAGDERQAINAAIGKLVDGLQVREREGRRELFNVRRELADKDVTVVAVRAAPVATTFAERRVRAKAFAQRQFAGKSFLNRDTGREIIVSNASAGHAVDDRGRSIDDLALAVSIPELLENAVLYQTRPPRKGARPNYVFYAAARMQNGDLRRVKIVANEAADGLLHYSQHIIEPKIPVVEGVPPASEIGQALAGSHGRPGAGEEPVAGRELTASRSAPNHSIKLGDLLLGVNPERLSANHGADPVATLSGDEIGRKVNADNALEQARDYYRTHLQGTTVEREGFGRVRFTGKGWQKAKRGLRTDIEKAKLLPAVPDIILNGELAARELVGDQRQDGIIAFHYFRATVALGGRTYDVAVSVGEDANGNLFYNLNHDPDALMQKRLRRQMDRGKALGLPARDPSIAETISPDNGDPGAQREAGGTTSETLGSPAKEGTPGKANIATVPARINLFDLSEGVPWEATTAPEGGPLDTAAIAGIRDALAARLKALKLDGKIALKVEAALRSLATGERLTGVDGSYYERLIQVSYQAPDAVWTLNHEVIHALRDLGLLKSAEWTSLKNAALADKAGMAEVRQRYKGQGLTEDQLVEELVADRFADWHRGRAEKGFARDAFSRIREFIRALYSALTGNGFLTIEQVYRGIDSGRVGGRGEAATGGAGQRQNVRRTDLALPETIDIDGVARPTRNSNGEPIHATEDGVRNFWRWFGDSKVVDDEGRPLVVYHGTSRSEDGGRFTIFDAHSSNHGLVGLGSYFTADREVAESYTAKGEGNMPTVYSVYLAIKNPIDMDAKADPAQWSMALDEYGFDLEDSFDRERGARNESWYRATEDAFQADGYPSYDIPDTIQTVLISMGHDGVTHIGGGRVRRDSRRHRVFIAFDPEQVKSAEGNSGAFDPADPRIRYNVRRNERREQPARPLSAEMPHSIGEALTDANLALAEKLRHAGSKEAVAKTWDDWRTGLQDRFLPLMRAEAMIEQATGKPLPANARAYRGEELMTGKIGWQMERLTEDMVDPFLNDLHARKVSLDELEAYLYARHAPERNAQIARINPEFSEGEGSGMTDAEAAAIMEAVEDTGRKADLDALAAQLDAILKFALDTRVEAGLLSKAEAAQWRKTYKHYVPLRGEVGVDPEVEALRPRRGSGINIRGPESRRAFGRKTRASDIFANALMQAQEAIYRAETNAVAQRFVELARAMPDPDFWAVNKVTRKAYWDKAAGQVRYRAESRLLAEDAPYTVSAKIDGEEVRVTLNRKNERAVKLATSMRNLKAQEMNWFVRVMGAFSRYVSIINTTLVPEFLVTNAVRDLQEASLIAKKYNVKGLGKAIRRGWFGAVWGVASASFSKNAKGEWAQWYRRFSAAGGRVSFNQIDDINTIRKRIDRIMAKKNRSPLDIRTLGIRVMELIEKVNLVFENAVRLSAFRKAIEVAGMTEEEAASLAKNITVNFNRTGQYGPVVNAGYVFFNASMQGGANVVLAATHSSEARKALGKLVLFGAGMALMNSMMSGEDDDGEKYYDKISDFDKAHNLIIMMPDGKNYAKIPYAWGLMAFPAIGMSVVDVLRGKKATDAAANLLSTIIDSWNPIGGDNSGLNFLAPTLVDPFVDLWRNRDFADRPIMPDEKQYGPKVPDNQRYWDSVGGHWKAITDFLNRATGGDEVRPGAIDVSPETLEYLFGFFAGGAGATVDRLLSMPGKIMNGELRANDIPFARKVVGSEPSWYGKATFYERAAQVEQAFDDYKKDRALGGDERAMKHADPDLMNMRTATKNTRRVLANLRQQRARANKDLDGAEKRERLREIKEREQEAVTRFNRLWNAHIGRADGEKVDLAA